MNSSDGKRPEGAEPNLDTYRVSVPEARGQASSSRCPRAGYIELVTKSGRTVVMETRCKTWRCLGCRDRIKSLFKARVEYGISHLEGCVFMTFTYRTGEKVAPRARSVTGDWRCLLKKWKANPLWSGAEWLRVMELTKKGTPHHHLAVGWKSLERRLGNEARCYGRVFKIKVFQERWDRCDCLSHSMSRLWLSVTGDSYIVHVVPIVGAAGAASYMAKYIAKEFDSRVATDLGMARRWSTSNGFPFGGQVRLAQTDKGWYRKQWRKSWTGEIGGPDDLMERVGDMEVMEMTRKRKLKGLAMELARKVGNVNSNDRTADVRGLSCDWR